MIIRPDLIVKAWTFKDLKKELGGLDGQFIKGNVLKMIVENKIYSTTALFVDIR